ncbi:hypothetical protein QYE76_020569 [Lolium multiflorum]|uniref:Gag-pol polyprotein n=1 Tax=Lolium multiflorum TaxID=4521 RepID=A0AAD8R653_LOLMU|nr:hypothetical protein QYE76_020569 [Lolium multiflorum]
MRHKWCIKGTRRLKETPTSTTIEKGSTAEIRPAARSNRASNRPVRRTARSTVANRSIRRTTGDRSPTGLHTRTQQIRLPTGQPAYRPAGPAHGRVDRSPTGGASDDEKMIRSPARFDRPAGSGPCCSVELWEIILHGYREPQDPIRLTSTEFYNRQLNASARDKIRSGINRKLLDQVNDITSAKELWDRIVVLTEGTDLIQSSLYETAKQEAHRFMIREGESLADAYARLGALKVRIKGLGAEKYDDGFEMNEGFIKSKVIAMIAVKQEDTNLALNLQIMTKSADLNSDDLVSYVAANENMAKAGKMLMAMNRVDEASHNHEASHNLSLKARADHGGEEEYEIEEDEEMTSTSDIATDFAFFAKKYKGKLPMLLNDKKKKRTCYNCDEESHFANECPYEKRVDKPKFIKGVKPRLKPNPINDRYKRNKGRAFVGAEYLSDEEEEDEEKEAGVAGLAFSKPGSLFTYDYSKDYSTENYVGSSFMARITQDDDSDDSSSSTTVGSCLMARETKVMEPPPSLSSVLDNEAENQDELTVLKELYNVRCTLRGEALVKFDFLMDSLKEKDESIEELEYHLNDKERRFNLLRQELKTERCISQGLKQQIETYELDKVKDLETIERAQSLTQELNASKEELEVAHASLTRDLDHLERANKLVKDELKKLGKNHDLLQETYSKALESMNDSIVDKNVACSSTTFTSEHAKLVAEHVRLQEELSLHVETNTYLESLVTKYGLNYYPNESACEQATTLEENVRLKKELAKFTTTKSKMGLDDLLSKQRSNNQKYGLGYVPKPYKKNNYKKEKSVQEKNKKVTNDGKAPKGKAASGDRTGPNNHYALFVDYYGDVYANYVGPRNGYAYRGYSIWGYSSGGPKWVFDSGCTNHMTGGRGVLDQFIEDINKKSSITFGDNSKGKDETHREFITFAKKAQRTYESEIKAIRTDNGTEFKNYTMQEFVDDEGIKHEFSAPYTPQQNGVVERKNRTIIEMARTIYYNRSTGTIEVSCDVVFLEDNGSQVEQVVPCVAGNDDDPSSAIKHMGIGHIRPMEVHSDDQGDGIEVSSSPQVEPSSTQVEPSSATQDISSTQDEPHPEEQEESPQPTEQDHDDDQETSSTHVQAQIVPHDQVLARDEFIDHEGTIRKIKAATRASDMKVDLVLGSISKGVVTRRHHALLMTYCQHHAFVSSFEPLKVHEALVDPDWVIAMQEELECFTRNEVWSLVERPKDHRINVIGTKWVFKNKQDEDGTVIRNKARLVAQGFAQIEGSWSGEGRGNVAKRGRTADPPRRSSSRVPPQTHQGTDIGSSAGGRTKSVVGKRKDKHAAQEDDEVVPTFNVGNINRLEWQELRTVNPYRFEQRTYTQGDKFFWTKTQAVLWDGYYDSHEFMKNGDVVSPKAINTVELGLHEATKYSFVVGTLKGMGLYDLMCLKPDDQQEDPTFCPLLVRQFHCTVFFHDDVDRTITWMTGKRKYSCTYSQFRAAMGCGGDNAPGYKIHSRSKLTKGDISFCYPANPIPGPPTISGMYYSYLVLAKMFRENLISKSGDTSEVRNYHLNLMYYCHPDRVRKIDGCDLIFCELKRAVLDRMTPNCAQYVQRLINYIVPAPLNTLGEKVIMDAFKIPTQEATRPDVPSMMPTTERRSKERHDHDASSSYSRRPKHGAARFFSSMWQMCKNTNDVAHQSLALNQETRRRQNEFMATRNVPVPPPGHELAPVVAPQWEMPPITDEMIQNFDFSMYAHGGLLPRTARTPTPPDDGDGDGDEDEVDSAARDDDEGSYSTGHEFY